MRRAISRISFSMDWVDFVFLINMLSVARGIMYEEKAAWELVSNE